MARWFSKRWVWAAVAGASLTMGVATSSAQDGPPKVGTVVTLNIDGKGDRQFKVLKSEKQPDGSYHSELKDPKSGETITLIDRPSSSAPMPPSGSTPMPPSGSTPLPPLPPLPSIPSAPEPPKASEQPKAPDLPKPKARTNDPLLPPVGKAVPDMPPKEKEKEKRPILTRIFGDKDKTPGPTESMKVESMKVEPTDSGKKPNLVNRILGKKPPAPSNPASTTPTAKPPVAQPFAPPSALPIPLGLNGVPKPMPNALPTSVHSALSAMASAKPDTVETLSGAVPTPSQALAPLAPALPTPPQPLPLPEPVSTPTPPVTSPVLPPLPAPASTPTPTPTPATVPAPISQSTPISQPTPALPALPLSEPVSTPTPPVTSPALPPLPAPTSTPTPTPTPATVPTPQPAPLPIPELPPPAGSSLPPIPAPSGTSSAKPIQVEVPFAYMAVQVTYVSQPLTFGRDVEPWVVSLQTMNSPTARLTAAKALAGCRDCSTEGVKSVLFQAARMDASGEVRAACIKHLSDLGYFNPYFLGHIETACYDPDPVVREAATKACAKMIRK